MLSITSIFRRETTDDAFKKAPICFICCRHRENNNAVDPAIYLISAAVRWVFPVEHQENFVGTWSWPLTTPIVATQEFGMSWFAKPGGYSLYGAYGGAPHTGIDMISETENRDVFAPSDGMLYVGKMACAGSTLHYLKIVHSPTLASYYLHTLQNTE